MPASVSTMFACSARCSLCASATSALACLAAASSAGRGYLESDRRLSSFCKGTFSGKPKGRPIGGGGGGRGADDEAPSSENMRPIVVSGFWIVRNSPVMGAVMLSVSFWSVERRGADGPAPSYEDSGGLDFSLNICCCCWSWVSLETWLGASRRLRRRHSRRFSQTLHRLWLKKYDPCSQ